MTFVAYLVGKPAQLPLVGNLVIVTFCWRCLFTFTAVGANAVIIVVVTAVIWLIGITLAVGLRCRFVNRIVGIAAKHRGFVRADTLPPNLRGNVKVTLQLVRHLAVSELEFGFGFASFVSVSGSIANSFLTCPRKVIALFHSGAAVPAAHAADRIIADNLTGVIASLHSAAVVLTAHAADPAVAGNRTGVIAFLYGGAAVPAAVIAAHAADPTVAGNRTGVVAAL